jgi:hypothetical protein
MGSSSGQAQSTSTQNLTPEQQQLVGLSMPGYQNFAASGQPTLPTGNQAVAPFNAAQTAGQNAVLRATGVGGPAAGTPTGSGGQWATGGGFDPTGMAGGFNMTGAPAAPAGSGPTMANTVGTAAGTNQYLSSGAFLDPGSNPYVQNAVKAATQPIYQNLNEVTNPAQQAQGASGSGVNYGGSREGVLESQNTRNANITAGNVAAGIENTALGQGLGATQAAINAAPGTATSLALPGATTSAVGDVQQQQAQNVLNANNQAQLQQWLLPLLQSQMLTQGAAATPGGSVSSTGQTTQQAAPWQIAAGLMAGAGSLFGGSTGTAAGKTLGLFS